MVVTIEGTTRRLARETAIVRGRDHLGEAERNFDRLGESTNGPQDEGANMSGRCERPRFV